MINDRETSACQRSRSLTNPRSGAMQDEVYVVEGGLYSMQGSSYIRTTSNHDGISLSPYFWSLIGPLRDFGLVG
jgi:hypothetical protein